MASEASHHEDASDDIFGDALGAVMAEMGEALPAVEEEEVVGGGAATKGFMRVDPRKPGTVGVSASRPAPSAPSSRTGGSGYAAAAGRGGAGGPGGAAATTEATQIPMIAGKKAYSSTPEGAGLAEMVKQIEATIPTPGKIITWDDVIGLDDAKAALEEACLYPTLAAQLGTPIRGATGVLLYGPPGTGKTQIARAVASQVKATFFNISPSILMSKFLGDSEKMVRALFDTARYYAPSIIFIDEVDALTTARGTGGESEASLRVKNELLGQIDGVGSGSADPTKIVLVLGATNRPWSLDEAFRRRFEKRVYIPLPDFVARAALFQLLMKGKPVDASLNYDVLALKTEGYSGADVASICKDVLMAPMRKMAARMRGDGVPIADMKSYMTSRGLQLDPVSMPDFESALRRIHSSVGNADERKRLEDWSAEFGSV